MMVKLDDLNRVLLFLTGALLTLDLRTCGSARWGKWKKTRKHLPCMDFLCVNVF